MITTHLRSSETVIKRYRSCYGLNKNKKIAVDLFAAINELEVEAYERKKAFKVVFAKDYRAKIKSEKITADFDDKEILKMPKDFRKDFRAGRITAHVRQRENGTFEIRCQYHNRKITASAKTLAEAKERFIVRLNSPAETATVNKSVKFSDYAEKWLIKAKKPFVKPKTYKDYIELFKRYIYKEYEGRTVASIKPLELQEFIDSFSVEGKNRTAKAIYQVLKALFEYAYADELVERSPMAKVKLSAYEQKRGKALTRAEEKILVDALKADPANTHLQAFVFMLYTGLRRSEVSTVEVTDKWVIALMSKRRKWQTDKEKKIPISPMLRKVLPLIEIEKIKVIRSKTLTDVFPRYIKGHHLHELRHTFITRAKECKIDKDLVAIWSGHSLGKSTNDRVYTHLEAFEKRQIEEIELYNYDFFD